MNEYARTYCAKDIEGLMAVFANNDDISVIGTGADELCVGRDQVRALFLRNLNEAKANQFQWEWKHISITNQHAVAAVKLTIHLEAGGETFEVPVRWTVALRHHGDRLVWLHRHASTAAKGQDEGTAYPKNKS